MISGSVDPMLSNLFAPVIAVSGVGAASLTAIWILRRRYSDLRTASRILSSLGAGVMLADTMGHILPDGFRTLPPATVGGIVLAVLLVLAAAGQADGDATGRILLIGSNYLHNFLDGAAIGISFSRSTHLGVVATAAILLHEVPHELGVFGMMVAKRASVREATLVNIRSALLALVGTILTGILGHTVPSSGVAAAVVVGGIFLHIACVDLLPAICQLPVKERLQQLCVVALGAGLLLISE